MNPFMLTSLFFGYQFHFSYRGNWRCYSGNSDTMKHPGPHNTVIYLAYHRKTQMQVA